MTSTIVYLVVFIVLPVAAFALAIFVDDARSPKP